MLIRRDMEETEGTLEAYEVPAAAEQLENWLDTEVGDDASARVAAAVRSICGDVAICKSINVDEGSRGQGVGSALLDGFLDELTADVVLLIADTAETQEDGFKIQTWYEDHGFQVLLETPSGPLMAYPEEIAERILQTIDDLAKPSLKQ